MNRILKSLALVAVIFATVFTSCEDEFGSYGSGSGNGSSGTEVTPPGDTNPPVTDPYDVTNFRCIRTLQEDTMNIWRGCWSPDGNYFAYRRNDEAIIICDANNWQKIKTLTASSGKIYSISWSPNGNYIVSDGAKDKTIRIWNLITEQCIRTLDGKSYWVTDVSYSPNGERIVSSSWRTSTSNADGDYESINQIKIWNANSGECIKTIERAHKKHIGCVRYSPDGRYLASSSNDGTIKIWDANSGACLQTLAEHSSYVWSVRWSPDGKYLASGSSDNTVKIWGAE